GGEGFAPDDFGGRWLAAARPVAETDWVAIVQERYATAVAPAEEMRSELFLYAIAALAVGGGLIVIFWYFVTQALTERSRTGQRRGTPLSERSVTGRDTTRRDASHRETPVREAPPRDVISPVA